MPLPKAFVIFFALLACGVITYVVAHNNLYPIAIVNLRFITAHTMEKDFRAANRYFYNVLLTYGQKTDPNVLEQETSQKEIRRAALEKLIIDILIYKEAQHRIGNTLNTLTDEMIRKNIDLATISQAAEKLYGLTIEEFKSEILDSEARREILQNTMSTQKEDYNAWLKNAKRQAKVIILLPGFKWDGEKVVAH